MKEQRGIENKPKNFNLPLEETGKIKLEREPRADIVHIHKPEGIYTIMYHTHVSPFDTDQFPLSLLPISEKRTEHRAESLPEKLDGLTLETGVGDWTKDPLNDLEGWKNTKEYKKVFAELEKRGNVPVFFTDPNIGVGAAKLALGELGLELAETYLGLRLLAQIANFKKSMDRRKFLKTAGKAGLGAWLATPFLSSTGRLVSEDSDTLRNTGAELHKLSHQLHPEQMIITEVTRDAIMAYKQEWLVLNRFKNEHAEFVTLIGKGHTEIESQIQASLKQKLELLRRLKPLLVRFETLATIYQIPEMNYDGTDKTSSSGAISKWRLTKTHEVSELKAILTTG
jgi:hypothetical protein